MNSEQLKKAQALAQALEITAETITPAEWSENAFAINQRQQLQGTSPAEYVQHAKDLRAILRQPEITLLDTAIESIDAFNFPKESRDSVYNQVAESIKSRTFRGPREKDQAEALERLKKSCIYAENVVYWLLNQEDGGTIGKSYRDAWKGYQPKDDRKAETVSDSEYLVLTEAEADKMADEYAENFADEYGTPEGIDPKYIDREAIKADYLADGRGPVLAGYDSTEREAGEFFIYRIG